MGTWASYGHVLPFFKRSQAPRFSYELYRWVNVGEKLNTGTKETQTNLLPDLSGGL